MKNNNLKGTLILTVAAVIWGLAFVAQSGAAALVPPFAFNALRSIIGALVLYLFWFFAQKRGERFFPENPKDKKQYFVCASVCGLCLSVAINFQQFGIAAYPKGVASEARAGFITALYVILVPIFSIFLKKKVGLPVLLGVLIAISGIYLLCFSKGVSGIYIGDFLIFLCAISFALHIMAVDKFVGFTGGVKLSIMQFLVAAVVSALLATIFEFDEILLSNILAAAPQILYLGVMSSGVAYTLQIVGQKYAEPTVASITMSLESVFAALGGWLISGNGLSVKELIGCVLVFAAIIVAQMPQKVKN
ncbi:MAG: DMT family transporter [Clostridia bacterium]|nr:DMT family transporter [Clostridia bacterium]